VRHVLDLEGNPLEQSVVEDLLGHDLDSISLEGCEKGVCVLAIVCELDEVGCRYLRS
jgi:hypothetical protein